MFFIPEPKLLTCGDPELWDCHVEVGKVVLRIDELVRMDDVKNDNSHWRVSVWGNDYFVMERDFSNHKDAISMFNRLSNYTRPITVSELSGLCFKLY